MASKHEEKKSDDGDDSDDNALYFKMRLKRHGLP